MDGSSSKDEPVIFTEGPSSIHFSSFDDYLRHITNKEGVERSFYVMDLAEVLRRVQLWKDSMHNIRPFYAVKTNCDRTLLRLLTSLNFSFDCASQGEIATVLEVGAAPQNIIFAHPVKSPGALQYARSVGVDLLTFDDAEELDKIRNHHPEARLLLRLLPQNVDCALDMSDKFGCPPEEAMDVLRRAKELRLNVVGISFHVGGLCQSADSFVATIRASRVVFDAAEKLGFSFTLLDIGGGFRGAKGSEDAFIQVTKDIKDALKEYEFTQNIELIAEPGTFFVSSAVLLVTGIVGTKNRVPRKNGVLLEKQYYINDGVFGSFYNGHDHYEVYPTPLMKEGETNDRPSYKSRIWGQTCSGLDLVKAEVYLPNLKPGEHIVWYNTGAYNRVICSSFCGMPLPDTRHVFANHPRFNFKTLSEDVQNFILETFRSMK